MVKDHSRGSLTVEACISLPVFLFFFFLLLFFCKAASIQITLDHVVSETVKEIAASAYPISFLNELEDELLAEPGKEFPTLAEELEKAEKELHNQTADNIVNMVFGLKTQNPDEILASVLGKAAGDYKEGLGRYLYSLLSPQYFSFKTQGKYIIAGSILAKNLEGSSLMQDALKIVLVEFPQGAREYEHRKKDSHYGEIGVLPDRDFGRNDVVIQVEYRLKVPIPLLEKREIVLRHTAVERAWLYGGNGIYTHPGDKGLDQVQPDYGADRESGEEDKTRRKVYITRTGSKYHPYPNCDYLEHSRIMISEDEALRRGYTEHRGCPERFK